ncbi:MAG: cytochrome c [Gemmataceae bacterium]
MNRFARATALGATLALMVAMVTGPQNAQAFDDAKEVKKAQQDILDLAKKVADGKDVSKEAADIKKKYEELNTVMHAYKPSTKGGIGTGLEPKAGDGIEIKVINLGKRALTSAALAKEKEALVKVAYINAAIADITHAYAPAKPKGGKGAKEWKQFCEEMKKSSLDLAKAVEAGDTAKIKAAANNLNNSCNNCHSDFRDS